MQREAVIVGADHRGERRIEVHARVLQRLEQPHHHAAEQRGERHAEVGGRHPALHGQIDRLGRRDRTHCRASTTTLPHIVWWPTPQYSWHTNGYSPGVSKRAVTREI